MKPNYENDESLPERAVVDGWNGIAFVVYGWQTEPNEDTEWTGMEERTGQIVVRMVGDDRYFMVDPEDIHEISEEDYCPECGQTGCYCYR